MTTDGMGARSGHGPLRPSRLLRVEGAVVAAGAIGAYVLRDASLLLFVAAILLPDLAIAAYLLSPRAGAIAYNAVHTYVGPAILLAAGVVAGEALAVDLGLIWAAHVGVDRAVGLGLKYANREFRDTHLQRV